MEFYIVRKADGCITIAFSKKKISDDQTLLATINFEQPKGLGDVGFGMVLVEMLQTPEFNSDWEQIDHQTISGAAFALVLQAFKAGVNWSLEHPNYTIK